MIKKETALILPDEIVMKKIFLIRGYKVMLDRDLADLYEVETKQLKRQVSRNIDRFPEDFMFELRPEEFDVLRSQFGTSSWGGSRYLPFAFTEHGILMLSSILNSKRSIQVNIQIMRIFVNVRQMLIENTDLRLAIEKLEKKGENNSKNIEVLFQYLDELMEKKEDVTERKLIGYKNQKKT